MPTLTNERHEHFAQRLAKGEKQHEAYIAVGYRGDEAAASKLANSAKIRARVAELLERVAEKTVINAAWVLDRAAELYAASMEAKAHAAARGALDLIGKHIAVQAFREPAGPSVNISFANLSDDELQARIAAAQAAVAGSKYDPARTKH